LVSSRLSVGLLVVSAVFYGYAGLHVETLKFRVLCVSSNLACM